MKRIDLSGASTAVLTLAMVSVAGQAQAQPQTTPEATNVDEIVVTGVRLANQRAIDVKRNTLGVIDSVTADDVGNLPDFNVGDALRRVPGVNVFYYQGEPRHVSLRGLNADYNSTTVDGFHMASPDPDGRRVFVEVLPSSLAQRIDVVKSGRADIEGHAIGGTVDFISRSVRDLNGDSVRLSARGGAFLQDEEFGGVTPTVDLEAVAGTRFGPDDQFGLVVSSSYWQRELFVPQLESGGQAYFYNTNGTRNTTPYSGNGLAVPQERRWYVYDNDRERSGLSAKLDWSPNDAVYAALNAYSYTHTEASDRYEDTAQVNAAGTVSNQTPTSGTLNSVLRIVQLGQLYFERQVSGTNLTTRFTPSEETEIGLKLGWSGATSENPQRWDDFRQNNQAYGYQLGNPIHTFTAVNPTQALDPVRYTLLNHRDENQTVDEDVYDAQVDLATRFAGEGFGYKVGARYQKTEREVDFERTIFTGTQYNLATVLDAGSALAPFGSTGSDFLVVSRDRANATFAQFGPSMTAARDVAASFNGDYTLDEAIGAAYVMGRYASGPLTATAGVRYETTQVEGTGRRLQGGVWGTATTDTDRDDWLPSAALSYDLREDLRLTASYARALGRARYSDLAPRGEVLNETTATPTLSRSNPDLQPRLADNYDLALDWFIDDGRGLLSVAVFRKVIEDEIFTFGALETVSIGGVNRQVLVTQARNSDREVTVDGLEIGFIKNFDFLPAPLDGFGVSGNLTFLSTDFPVTLADLTVTQSPGLREQAKDIINLTLFYERGPLQARVAYNRTGEQWESRFSNLTNQAEFYRNRYQQPYETVDVQVRYDVTDRLTLQLEGQNLFDERKQDNIGRDQEIPQALIGLAPAVYVGVGYRW
jgi:TonB-dependent receptor